MPWERRKDSAHRYYTRSSRVEGRIQREYVGGGLVGQLAAEMDAEDRARRAAEARALSLYEERLEPMDQMVAELDAACTLLSHAALLAAGYHKHGGEWRLRRDRRRTANDGT